MSDIIHRMNQIERAKGSSKKFEENDITSLPDHKFKHPTGMDITKIFKNTVDPENGPADTSLFTLGAGTASPVSTAPPPVDGKKIDYRNKDGINYISPALDQLSCGSCVAFTVTHMIEAMCHIKKNKIINLSEGDLYYCLGGFTNCGGWALGDAISKAVTSGIVENSVYSYYDIYNPSSGEVNTSIACPSTTFRPNSAVKAIGKTPLATAQQVMNHLISHGPVAASIQVFEDFDTNTSEVYSYQTGSYLYAHAILIVGFDNTAGNQYWICKNSRGPLWGDNGFIKIKMGQIGIDSFYRYGITDVSIPASLPTTPVIQDPATPLPAPSYNWDIARSAPLIPGSIYTSKPSVTSLGTNNISFVTIRDKFFKTIIMRINANGSFTTDFVNPNLPISFKAPAVAQKDNTKIYVCGVNNVHNLYITEGTIAGSGAIAWSNYTNRQGSILSDPSMYINNNRLFIAARNSFNQLVAITCNLTNNTWDSDWKIISSAALICRDNTSLSRDAAGNTTVFIQGMDNVLYRSTYNHSNNSWSPLVGLGTSMYEHFVVTANPVSAANPTFRNDFFAIQPNGKIAHKYLQGNAWSNIATIEQSINMEGIAACERSADKIDIFTLNFGSQLMRKTIL